MAKRCATAQRRDSSDTVKSLCYCFFSRKMILKGLSEYPSNSELSLMHGERLLEKNLSHRCARSNSKPCCFYFLFRGGLLPHLSAHSSSVQLLNCPIDKNNSQKHRKGSDRQGMFTPQQTPLATTNLCQGISCLLPLRFAYTWQEH